MSEAKKTKATPPASLTAGLISLLAKRATSSVYSMGDHGKHTWGIEIPCLAFQWLVGGSNILPSQRFFRVSGPTKSLKSTLMVEIGNWHVEQGGIFLYDDNEGKTSKTMLDGLSWWRFNDEQLSRQLMTTTSSCEQWMEITTATVRAARDPKPPEGNPSYWKRKPGERVPIFVVVDSLMGKEGVDQIEALEKEGSVEARGYATLAGQVTRFLDRFSMLGTTMSMGYVQHLKPGIDGELKEKGAIQAGFSCSVGIRIQKGAQVAMAEHPLFEKGPQVTGYELWFSVDMSCLGEDKHRMMVQVLWQYVPQPDGTTRQMIKYDWFGALGRILYQMKYDPKDKEKLYKFDIDRLNQTLLFTAPSAKTVTCKELGLEDVDFTTFGMAIERNPEVRAKIAKFLNISQSDTIQTADIDWDAGSSDP